MEPPMRLKVYVMKGSCLPSASCVAVSFLFIVAHVNVQAQKGGANAYDDPCCAIHNVI